MRNKIEEIVLQLMQVDKTKTGTIEEHQALINEFVDRIEQLLIHSVVKSFYCVDNCKSKGSVEKCDNQCTGCWQVEKRSKQ